MSKHVAFLVAFHYGQGAVWAYIKAESARQINERLPHFTVFEAPPDCMTELELSDIEARMSWLASVIERRRKGTPGRRLAGIDRRHRRGVGRASPLGLTASARQYLAERLRFCEERHLDAGAAFYHEALDTWEQAEYDAWSRIDDLSAHPRDVAELEGFRELGLKGLGEQDIR